MSELSTELREQVVAYAQAMPRADAAFLLDQIGKGATVAEAKDAYITHLEARQNAPAPRDDADEGQQAGEQ